MATLYIPFLPNIEWFIYDDTPKTFINFNFTATRDTSKECRFSENNLENFNASKRELCQKLPWSKYWLFRKIWKGTNYNTRNCQPPCRKQGYKLESRRYLQTLITSQTEASWYDSDSRGCRPVQVAIQVTAFDDIIAEWFQNILLGIQSASTYRLCVNFHHF